MDVDVYIHELGFDKFTQAYAVAVKENRRPVFPNFSWPKNLTEPILGGSQSKPNAQEQPDAATVSFFKENATSVERTIAWLREF